MIITVSAELRAVCPQFVGAAVSATVVNMPQCEALWEEIDRCAQQFVSLYTPDSIKDIPAIRATRQVYKLCGKDPSRYRPSGEALCRRILRGQPLYRVNTLVDLINLVSIRHGYSIGGFDADRIVGDRLELGIGREGEPYEGIGRGPLNIAGLPVYRDTLGGIGTPTSDHERTKLSLQTTHLLALINGYSGSEGLADAAAYLRQLLETYASASEVTITTF